MEIPTAAVSIQKYLSQTDRLVYALVDPNQVEALGHDRFRLRMQPLKFMMLNLEPVSEIQVYLDRQQVMIASDHCKLLGQDALNRRFSLKLRGSLWPQTNAGQTQQYLCGEAHLQVNVDLPAAFRLTPKALIESTGNSILTSILLTIKQRLLHQLMADYTYWASHQAALSSRT